MTPDAELLRAAVADPDAFRELYGRYAVAIHGYFTGGAAATTMPRWT